MSPRSTPLGALLSQSGTVLGEVASRRPGYGPVAAAREVVTAKVLGHVVRVVSRGALVAMKFSAAVSPTRKRSDRGQDLVDMRRIVEARFTDDDSKTALAVAEAEFPGAREELARLLDDLRSDRPIEI